MGARLAPAACPHSRVLTRADPPPPPGPGSSEPLPSKPLLPGRARTPRAPSEATGRVGTQGGLFSAHHHRRGAERSRGGRRSRPQREHRDPTATSAPSVATVVVDVAGELELAGGAFREHPRPAEEQASRAKPRAGDAVAGPSAITTNMQGRRRSREALPSAVEVVDSHSHRRERNVLVRWAVAVRFWSS